MLARAIKEEEREKARVLREEERFRKEQAKLKLAQEKAAIKQELQDAKDSYEYRVLERRDLTEEYINLEIK